MEHPSVSSGLQFLIILYDLNYYWCFLAANPVTCFELNFIAAHIIFLLEGSPCGSFCSSGTFCGPWRDAVARHGLHTRHLTGDLCLGDKANVFLLNFLHLLHCLPTVSLLVGAWRSNGLQTAGSFGRWCWEVFLVCLGEGVLLQKSGWHCICRPFHSPCCWLCHDKVGKRWMQDSSGSELLTHSEPSFFSECIYLFLKIEMRLTYTVMLVSGVRHSFFFLSTLWPFCYLT